MSYGYNFYFSDGGDVLTFPITPGQLKINIGSNNKTITLINEGDINLLKSPSLVEVEFEARFPMRKYPYSREPSGFQTYFDKFKSLKEEKRPFRFIVARATPGNKRLWDTNLSVALEDMKMEENADEGDDVLITFKLKQYKDFGVKQMSNSTIKKTTSTSDVPRSNNNKATESTTYKVESGDCLYNIAKAAYDNASKWKDIYNANKSAIEADAKKHGKQSSSNGHWIWPGLKLTIPGVGDKKLKVKKLW